MKCMSKEWIIKKDPKTGAILSKKTCELQATKKCRHGFATCEKHNHGCKNEERFRMETSLGD